MPFKCYLYIETAGHASVLIPPAWGGWGIIVHLLLNVVPVLRGPGALQTN